MKPNNSTPIAAGTGSPVVAISIRQPWAWLVVHGGKDIENRTWPTRFRGRVLVHASKGMTRDEWAETYFAVAEIDSGLADRMPRPDQIERGGIVGEIEIVDCVAASSSKWFGGPFGFVLRNPKALPFQPCKGALGFFRPFGLGVAGTQLQGPCREPAIRQVSLMENPH